MVRIRNNRIRNLGAFKNFMWFSGNDYSRRKCPKSSHRYARQSTVVLVLDLTKLVITQPPLPLGSPALPTSRLPALQPWTFLREKRMHTPPAHLQVMFLYLSLHSCPRNWWSTWLQALGRWFVVWLATMAKFGASEVQVFFFGGGFRKTWDIPTSHPLVLGMAMGSQLTSGQDSLEFFTPDEATWCGGMPNTWRSQCHISWPLGGVGLTWSLYITLKGQLSDHMGLCQVNRCHVLFFVQVFAVTCGHYPLFIGAMWVLPKVYTLCIMGVYLNSPATGPKFRIQVDFFQQFGTVESFFDFKSTWFAAPKLKKHQ